MISQTAEYALRAMVDLASHPGEPRTNREIGDESRVPVDYLAKVMKHLVRAGLVLSRRGRRGGFQLGRPAEKISVLDVVNAVDPVTRIEACPLGLPEHRHRLCPLHRKLDKAIALVEESFRETPLAALLDEATPGPSATRRDRAASSGTPRRRREAPARGPAPARTRSTRSASSR